MDYVYPIYTLFKSYSAKGIFACGRINNHIQRIYVFKYMLIYVQKFAISNKAAIDQKSVSSAKSRGMPANVIIIKCLFAEFHF